jgi:nucleoside-diphosphate-sugar epimerase
VRVDVAIAGGHGQIALRLARLLSARSDRVRGLIRNADHADDVRAAGAEPVLCDLEVAAVSEVAELIGGADAIVFAAGAGPGSGAERKRTMDLGGASKTIAAARQTGVDRYVIVSSMGAGNPPPPGEGDVFGDYLRAKAAADAELAASSLQFTIVRPGALTNDPGTGRVQAAPSVPRGSISRDDVAAVIVAVLDDPRTSGLTFELVGGDSPIADALQALL